MEKMSNKTKAELVKQFKKMLDNNEDFLFVTYNIRDKELRSHCKMSCNESKKNIVELGVLSNPKLTRQIFVSKVFSVCEQGAELN